MYALKDIQAIESQPSYKTGEYDYRPWGFYEVLKVGKENNEEFCTKKIGIKPRKALSLQRHQGRREIWTVEEGTLTVVINGIVKTIQKHEHLVVPQSAVHCMINLMNTPVIVHEKQIGLCHEGDNERLWDMYGRATVAIAADDYDAQESVKLYRQIIETL